MLNRYPLWKYLMLLAVLLIGILYAIPNLYGEDPSVQITGIRGIDANAQTVKHVINILKKENIASKSIILKSGVVLARFNNTDVQLHACESLASGLGENYTVALNLAPATPYWLSALGGEPMKLGLDLRGGVHFLMKVDIETILGKLVEQNIDNLRSDLREQGMSYLTIQKTNNYNIAIRFCDNKDRSQAESYFTKHYRNLIFTSGNNNVLTVTITEEGIRKARYDAISQNINIIRNRVNQLGVSEPLVQRQGVDCIVVELPGIQDTARAKEILGTTAMLEFRLVNTSLGNSAIQESHMPANSEIKYTRDGDAIWLYKRVIVTGDHIIDSTSDIDEIGRPQVSIVLDSTGGSIMSDVTRDNQNKLMATLFIEYKDRGQKAISGRTILAKEDQVINVARISARFDRKFRITGISNSTEARQLALLLRAGALIAPMKIIEEQTIGPTLGFQNIKQGIKASLASLLAAVLFMVIYYRICGLIASVSLLANLVLIVGVMSFLPGITLTMTGIAGIVLTLAVAVDANVLINERIKEELKNGRSVQQAIHEGYHGSLSSILDANVTTMITAIILYAVGTGSIKGFAITTAIGIATSMFTAIIGTRAIVNLLYGGKRINKLSI